jgi:hypothetical protein
MVEVKRNAPCIQRVRGTYFSQQVVGVRWSVKHTVDDHSWPAYHGRVLTYTAWRSTRARAGTCIY